MPHKFLGVLGETARAELSVVLVDSTGLAGPVREGLQEEVAAIYAAAGVRVRWLDESSTEQGSHVARVYLMDELPRSVDTRIRAFSGNPMARALGREGDSSGPTMCPAKP